MKTVYKGVRQQGNDVDSYQVGISLPARFGVGGNSEFNLGTVYGLENAIEIRNKAEEIKKEYFGYGEEEDCIYYLNELREFVKSQHMTKDKAADVLDMMLYEHKCNACFLDFSNPSSDDEKEAIMEYINKEKALAMAIKCLRNKRRD